MLKIILASYLLNGAGSIAMYYVHSLIAVNFQISYPYSSIILDLYNYVAVASSDIARCIISF